MPPATARSGSAAYFHPQVETMERSSLDALVEERLLDSIRVAYAESALVRGIWQRAGVTPDAIGTAEDFRRLAPFIEKDDLRGYLRDSGDPAGAMLGRGVRDLVTMGSSSGTTGEVTPKPLAVGGAMWTHLNRSFWGSGLRPGDYLMFCYFTFTLGHYFPLREAGVKPIYLHHEPASVPHLLALSRQYRPKVCYVMSVPLLVAIEEHVEQEGIDPRESFSSYETIIFGGDFLGPRLAGRCRDWGMPLRQVTAAGDVVGAWQCGRADGYHFYEDVAYIELVDPVTGAPVPRGPGRQRGELVATALADHSLLSFVRFRSGDIVELSHEPCGCGRTHARIWPLGRASDATTIDGLTVYPRDILPLIEAIPASRAGLFQIVRPSGRQSDALHLRVGYAAPGPTGTLAAQISDAVSGALGLRPTVDLVPNEELLRLGPPHKIPRMVSR